MAYSLRKIQLAIAALVMVSTGYAHGSIATSGAGCDEGCGTDTCCSDSCCGTFFVGAEALYLRAYEGGLSNVCEGTEIVETEQNNKIVSRLHGKSHDPDFKWNLGFRLGAGYKFGDCNCGIGAYWTHFNSHNDGHDHDHRWKLDFDVIDLLYGCDYDLCNCFVLTPFAGLRYARIEQKLNTHFVSTVKGSDPDRITSTGHIKEDFWGIGPLFGLEGDWGMGCGFSLYGRVSLAFLYGNFHVRSHQNEVFHTGTNINHLRHNTDAYQAVVDTGFGVRWRTCVCDNPFTVQLGLEQHRYFNHNQFCGYGDLSLDGVSLAVGYEY